MAYNYYRREYNILRLFVLVSFVIFFILEQFSRVDVDYASFMKIIYVACGWMLLSILARWRQMKYFSDGLELISVGILLVIPIVISTYLAMALDKPLADAELIAMDQALGLNWHGFIAFVDSNPYLANALMLSYTSFNFQLMFVPFILVFFNDVKRGCAFMFGYGVVCFLSSFISIWYPALGTYTVYGVTQADLSHINTHFGFFFLDAFNAVRSGEPITMVFGETAGILTFPSVHAGIAFLVIWAMWTNKWLRWPFVILNIMMAVSAVSHANHYLIDVVAALGVTGVSVALSSYIFLGYRPFWFAKNEPAPKSPQFA